MSEMKKIVFVHSPIQAYLVKAMLAKGVLAPTDRLVFHRGFEPPAALKRLAVGVEGYALNKTEALLRLMSDPEPVEVVLPHSLCVAYHFAELSPNVTRISYLEEGTGTPFALKNPLHPGRTKRRKKNVLQKIARFLTLLATFGPSKIEAIRRVSLAEDEYNTREKEIFIRFDSSKFGLVYGLAYWQEESNSYLPVHVEINKPKAIERKVVIAVGKQEAEKSEYWSLLERIQNLCEPLNVKFFTKLHPSIDRSVLLKKCPQSAKVINRLEEFNPLGNELGFALIEEGFLGAISFFSSYQIYAHVAAREAETSFPMLALEGMMGANDFQKKLDLLPEIGLMNNVFFSVESWLGALQEKLKAAQQEAR